MLTVKQKKLFTVSLIILIPIIAIYWWYSIYFPATDDAYVQANIINVAPQVDGIISTINIENHQHVKAGQLLFIIDPAPFQIKLQEAQASLEITKQEIASDIDAVNSANAVVAERQAAYENAVQDSTRAIKLSKKGVLSKQAADDAIANIKTTLAQLNTAKAQLQQAKDTLGKLGDENAQLKKAEADVAQAQLNLQYTKVYAAAEGNIENLTLRKGDVVRINAPIFAIVDETQWWVDANYYETDLKRILPGQKATIKMDMYSKEFTGIVESVSRASGASFSLLPPENATGNWVKVTQRFPVRIRLTSINPQMPPRIGASAEVTINTL